MLGKLRIEMLVYKFRSFIHHSQKVRTTFPIIVSAVTSRKIGSKTKQVNKQYVQKLPRKKRSLLKDTSQHDLCANKSTVINSEQFPIEYMCSIKYIPEKYLILNWTRDCPSQPGVGTPIVAQATFPAGEAVARTEPDQSAAIRWGARSLETS